MPRVNGKEFPYTAAGKAAAVAYRKLSNKGDGQKPITQAEVLKNIPQPSAGETQGSFVKGQLAALDEGDRGVLSPQNSTIARKVLVEFYRRWAAQQTAKKRGMRVR